MAISRKQELGCPIERALRCVGARYKAMIVYRLLDGPLGYGELRRAVEGVSERMLTLQLRQLLADGVVSREPSGARARGVRYRLTPAGEALRPVFDAMYAWGTRHGPRGRAGLGAARVGAGVA